MEDKIGEKPEELMKLIKICCSLSHGQAGVERGFSETKRIVADRPSLNDDGVKGLKTVREAVRNCGGAENVNVNFSMLNFVKKASAVKLSEELELKRKREEEEKAAEEAAEVSKRQKLIDESKEKWETKKKRIEDDIVQAKATLSSHDGVLTQAMGRAIAAKKVVDKNAALETVKAAKEAIDKVNEELEYLNKKLVSHMSKQVR